MSCAQSGGEAWRQLPLKMRFLDALRAAMAAQRAAGREVILAGDLNLVMRDADVFWQARHLVCHALTPIGNLLNL